MKILKFAACAALVFASHGLCAFSAQTGKIQHPKMFGINFADGSSYYALAEKVVSVSKQAYVAGPLFVTEVCIELDQSPLQVRIYNARAVPADKAAEAAAKKIPYEAAKQAAKSNILKRAEEKLGGVKTQQNVYKDYPATTHARTLEFVVSDLEELEIFYEKFSGDYARIGGESLNKKIYTLEK